MSQWISYVILALLAGFTNCLVAWVELNKKCRCLPFFEPQKSFGFWLWSLLQISIPSVLFWYILSLQSKPEIDLVLIFQALTTGIIFNGVLNASTEIGTFPVNVKLFHDLLLNTVYELINSQYISKTAEFWIKLDQELNQNYISVNTGLRYLDEYFSNNIFLDRAKKQEIEEKLQNIRDLTQQTEKIKAIVNIFKAEVERKDLPRTLKNFNCSPAFLQDWNLKTYSGSH